MRNAQGLLASQGFCMEGLSRRGSQVGPGTRILKVPEAKKILSNAQVGSAPAFGKRNAFASTISYPTTL